MIGQTKIISRLSEMFKRNEIPQFIVFTGQKGSGKKTLIKTIFPVSIYRPKDLKVDSIREIILDAQSLKDRRIYLLADCENMTLQAQNALLKLAEEPPTNAFIMITVSDIAQMLPTIKSRATVINLEPYTRDELFKFTTDELLLNLCENPGQIKRYQEIDYVSLYETCEKVAKNIGRISAWNVFNVLRYTEEKDYDLIIPMLLHSYHEIISNETKFESIIVHAACVKIIIDYKQLIKSKSINLEHALEMMLMDIRKVNK